MLNDTDTQVSFRITTEKYGRLRWTYKPGHQGVLSNGPDKIRLRVGDDDMIEIADWGKTTIRDVAEYRDGAWYLSIHNAHRILRPR
ncbi:MAG: hypothetical protein C0399_12770 [Syntrophus sp. (in: bacteria)]|nr:hypothetical protein [Syntrophus sp. (in: bacteria)]